MCHLDCVGMEGGATIEGVQCLLMKQLQKIINLTTGIRIIYLRKVLKRAYEYKVIFLRGQAMFVWNHYGSNNSIGI